MCEDQEICAGLALWCKILQEGRRKKVKALKNERFQGMTQTLEFL